YAKGRPQLHRACVIIMAIVMLVFTYPFAKELGLAGAQVACLIAGVAGYTFQLLRIRHLTGVNLAQYGRAFAGSALGALTVVAIYLCKWPFAALSAPLPNIVFGIVGCIVAYGLGLAVLRRSGH